MGRKLELDGSRQLEAVMGLLCREETGGRLALRYGISENTLYRLRDDFLEGGKAGLASRRGKGDPRDREIAELRKDLEERDRVIGELTIANRILKKTAERSL